MKKFLTAAFTAAVLILSFCVTTFAAVSYPEPTPQFFVNDYAGIISSVDADKIQKQGENLYNACKAQVAVVTVENMGGMEIEDYSLGLARKWGLGDKEKNNGVLIILSVSERKVRIEVGSGLEGALPDSKTGRIMDTYGINYFKENKFSEGLASVYNSVVNEVYIEYGLSPDENYEPVGDEHNFDLKTFITLIAIFGLIGGTTIFRIIKRGGGGFMGPFTGGFYGGFSGRGGGFSGRGGSGGGFSGGGGGFSGGGSSRGF